MSKDSLDNFDVLSDDILIEEVGGHIQANLQDEIVREALKSGVDLREYSEKIKSELKDVERLSVQDYINHRDQVINLHQQITSSDDILKRMEGILENFHEDLGSISSDIQNLQQKSLHMHQCLQNRQVVRGELCQFMAEMVVPEQMINHILETSVTDRYFVEQLHELDHKLKFVSEQSFRDSKSAQDVSEILEQLKVKSILKIREYILQKIYSFKKPMTNFQVPQEMMLKYRFFNEFLLTHDRIVASEINKEYLDTAGKIYYSYFKAYLTKLMKLQFDKSADKEDLLGSKDDSNSAVRRANNAASSILSFNQSNLAAGNLKNRSTVFSLAQRDALLNPAALEEPIILPHAVVANQKQESKKKLIDFKCFTSLWLKIPFTKAIGQGKKFTFENLFRSLHYALLDNCCREYLFLCDFFLLNNDANHANVSQDMFNVVMGKTINFYYKQMETYVASCFDALALLLCIRIVKWYMDICKERLVPALNNYWTLLLNLLWPRWLAVMDAHIQSLRQHHTNPSSGSGGSGSQSNMLMSHFDRSRFSGDVRPYSVTRQYAEFCAALHTILRRRIQTPQQSSSLDDSPPPTTSISHQLVSGESSMMTSDVMERLLRLQIELEAMLLRIADTLKSNKDRLTFFINNCDLILSVLTENNVIDCAEGLKFKDIMGEKINEYVEEVLLPYFGSLIHFIKDTEINHPKTSTRNEYTSAEEIKVQKIIKGFNIDWKNSVEKINGEILTSFTNFCIGTQIFQTVVSQLITYYRRLQACMNLSPYKNMPVKSELVNIHHIMVEMKKFKPNF